MVREMICVLGRETYVRDEMSCDSGREKCVLGRKTCVGKRELYWEGLRRPDLIRNNQFIGANYVWPFKAGAANGKASENHRKIFPLPEDILLVNENLIQNPDY